MSRPRIYLAGPIEHVTLTEATRWRDDVIATLDGYNIVGVSPLRKEESRTGKLSGKEIFAKNMIDVRGCDAVLAYVPEGISATGTAIEMGACFALNKPIFIVTDKLELGLVMRAASSFVFDDFEEACQYIGEMYGPYTVD